MESEKEVLAWMISQKEDETIEEIDRETLFEYIGSKDFLAVIFCKHIFVIDLSYNRNNFIIYQRIIFRRCRESRLQKSSTSS